MILRLDVDIDGLHNSQKDEVQEGLIEYLNKLYGKHNVNVGINDDTEYDEEEITEPDDE